MTSLTFTGADINIIIILRVNTVIKLVYIVHTVGQNYNKKIGFPFCRKKQFNPPSNTSEAREERSSQSYSVSHIA